MQDNLLSRRRFQQLGLAGSLAASLGVLGTWPGKLLADELKYNDDGLIMQPWFVESFLILQEDLADAKAHDKRFVVFWELKGCPYCKETHRVNLAEPDILKYVKANFSILQLNIIGSRIVTDFDGEELSEKELARKWQVKFTPTIQFFTDDVDAAKGRDGHKNEVARIPGYFKPAHFLAMFRYVEEKAYTRQKFHEYVRAKTSG
jgi:thioredoxin-related protein